MNNRILEQLEFQKVKKQFEPFIKTEQGLQALTDLSPMVDGEKIKRRFLEIADMGDLFMAQHYLPLGSLTDISNSLRRLELEADLNIGELIPLKRVLQVSAELQSFYANLDNVSLKVLNEIFEKIESFPALQGSLQAINEGGFIEDFASPELAAIRQRILQKESQVRSILQDMLKSHADYLSENLVASRNGRSVLPVKNTFRNKLSGVVHDISSSGSTVYIEPRAVVTLNEDLTQDRADERHEIERILQALSEMIRPHTAAIRNNTWLIGQLDLIQAKWLYLREKKATIPQVAKDKSVLLLNARHPLLANPVPNDLSFPDELTAIVITGPNTGGKTIILKTLGLAQLMAQSGLPILADEGSQIAVFNHIFADIGDEQSIEQSLSTFSSHMTHIVSILEEANQDSLVLFDELGAGTDPQEGASLAMSILEHLRLSQIKTMATTHYPELKAYGIETPYVENASMAFDTVTLRPTYQFMQGVPGQSNAFEIARRLGLADLIVTQAENMLDTDKDVNRIIDQLEQQTAESRRRLDNIKVVEQENLKFNRAVKKLYNDFSHAWDKELEKAKKEAQDIVDMALEESDKLLKTLHDKSQLKPHEIIEAKGQLKKLAPEQSLTNNKVLKKAKALRAAKVGDDIMVLSYGQRGTLVKQLKDGRWEAQVGLIKMTLKESEFNLIKQEQPQSKPKTKQISVVKKVANKSPKGILDLRGKRYEEAMEELDAFIDQALLNNMSQVDIIHGIGTGVIREGVSNYLRRNKHVKSFGYAPQNAGGSGATIVNLE
ncbi:endonuclease MutS2 [Streptococcus fryi]